MRALRHAGLVLPLVPLLLLAAALPAAADAHPNTQGGVDVNQIFQVGAIDDINLFNGALTVAIPLGLSYPDGARMSYRVTLVANSNPWVFWSNTTPTVTYSESQPSQCSNAGLGWRVSFGAVAYSDEIAVNAPGTPVCAAPAMTVPLAIYEGPDGAQHVFYATLHAGDPDDNFNGIQDNPAASVENVQYTRDGSYLRLIRSNAHTASESTTIEFPNGEIHSFNNAGQITQIKDRFNNQVNFSYLTTAASGCPGAAAGETSCWKIADTMGRAHWIYFRTDLPVYNGTGIYQGLISRIVLSGFNASQSIYTFNYTTSTIGRGCPMTDPNVGDIMVPLLASVTQPDGSQYQPTAAGYVLQTAGAGSCVNGSGSLTHLTLPIQGTVDWTYQSYFFPSASAAPNQRPFRTENPGILTRTTFDGTNTATWQYATTFNSPTGTTPYVMNQVTDPLGSRWQRYFSLSLANVFGPGPNSGDYGLQYNPTQTQSGNNPPTASDVFLSEQVLDALGNVRRTIYRRYEHDVVEFAGAPPDGNNNNDRLAQEVTVYDDGTQTGYVDADFDGVGHYRYRQTSGTLPGNDVRITRQQWNAARGTYAVTESTNTLASTYNYLPPTTPWVLTTKTFDSQGEGGVAQGISYCYDANTGFLLRSRAYFSSAIPWNADPGGYTNAADVIVVATADGLGDVANESYYGGDVNPVTPTSSDVCQQTVPAAPEYEILHGYAYGAEAERRYAPAGFYSLNLAIDPSTGLAASSFDTANIKTSFQYDGLGRLNYVLPQGGAWTQYLYNTSANPVSVTEQKQQNGSPGTVLAQTKYLYDGWGRLKEKDVLMADGTTRAQSTAYNALGWKAAETELGSLNQTTYNYGLQNVSGTPIDPFGRVGLLRYPDGHSVSTTYTGIRAVQRQTTIGTTWNGTTVTEAPATTTATYDRFGRLASVAEPSGASGAQVTTAYSYDPGNRLLLASTTSGSTTQKRTYAYDGRGLVRSETHPERTGAKTYSSYDSRGHVHRAQDGVNDLSYTYDGAERPLLVYNTANGGNCSTNPAVSATCLKQFRYDGTSDSLGRLYQASRFNHMTLSGAPYGDKWTYTYTYQGLDGRLSERDLQHTFCSSPPGSCQATGAEESFTQSWVYTQLGDVGTENYPTCAAAFTSCVGITGRSVQSTYSNGFLTGIAGYTGGAGITYYPNGMVSSVTAFNGVTTTYGADPFGMARPSSITATGPGGTLWTSGTYAYDGAGNVTRVGQSYYTYDGVSRLTNAQVETNPLDGVGTTFATQSYTWDAFGNHVAAFGGIDQSANAATNQLNAGTYDAAGNLRMWSPMGLNTATYDYDELNNLKHYKNGADEWLYMYDADDERIWSFQVAGAPTPPRFDRWTLRGLDGAVRRTIELTGYNWNATSTGWTSANSWEDYVYRGGVLLANYPNNAQRRTLSVDHLGSPRLVTNGNGNETAFHAYLPFGEEATSIAQDCAVPPCEREKFAGQERDLADSTTDRDDLDYLHARHYSPLTGRFLSLDSHAANDMLPQSWNRYAYTRGNPLRLVDRNGKEPITFQITTEIEAPIAFAPRLFWPYVGIYGGGMKTTQTFTIETDPKVAADPIVSSSKDTGTSVRYDFSNNPVDTGKASPDGIGLIAGRDTSGTAYVFAGASAADPLEYLAPPLVYTLMLVPDQSGTSISYALTFGLYPTMDITATNSAGQTLSIFHFQESDLPFAPFFLFCGSLPCGLSESGTVSFGIRH